MDDQTNPQSLPDQTPDWAVETPDWAQTQPPPAQSTPVQPNDHPYRSANQKKSIGQNFEESFTPEGSATGIPRGMEEAGIGLAQLTEGPTYGAVNAVHKMYTGKDLPFSEEDYNNTLNQYAKTNRQLGEGTGVGGEAGELLGDPRNYIAPAAIGPEMKGAATAMRLANTVGTGATLGAGYGITAPSENEQTGESGMGQRLENTAKSGLTGAFAAPLVEGGVKTLGYPVNWAANKVAGAFKAQPEVNPVDLVGRISQNYQDEKNVANEKAAVMRFFANDEDGTPHTVEANGIQNWMTNTIGDLKSSPSPSEQRAARTLQNIQDRVVGKAPSPYYVPMETGTQELTTSAEQAAANTPPVARIQPIDQISYNDLVDIKQALNENFNSSRFRDKGDRAIGQLASVVNDGLAKAGEQTPEFGNALADFNNHYANEIGQRFRNDTLSKFWKPEDFYGDPTSVDYRSRARDFMDKIQTPEDLEAVADAITPRMDPERASVLRQTNPDQLQAELQQNMQPFRQLAQAKMKQLADDSDTTKQRVANFGMAAFDTATKRYGWALKNAYRGLTGGGEDNTALNDSLKNFLNPQPAIPTAVGDATIRAADAGTARGIGDSQQNTPLKMTVTRPNSIGGRPNMAPPDITPPTFGTQTESTGGTVHSQADWLTLVRNHGQVNGITVKDRLTPEKVRQMDKLVQQKKNKKNKYGVQRS